MRFHARAGAAGESAVEVGLLLVERFKCKNMPTYFQMRFAGVLPTAAMYPFELLNADRLHSLLVNRIVSFSCLIERQILSATCSLPIVFVNRRYEIG